MTIIMIVVIVVLAASVVAKHQQLKFANAAISDEIERHHDNKVFAENYLHAIDCDHSLSSDMKDRVKEAVQSIVNQCI